jgi:hypothetical protein
MTRGLEDGLTDGDIILPKTDEFESLGA